MATSKQSAKAQTPQAILTGAEVAILAAILGGASKSAADMGVKGTEALVAYFRKEGPIASRVLASWQEAGHYCIAIEFLNVTLHGGYVEELDVTQPSKNFDFQVARTARTKRGISFGDNNAADAVNGKLGSSGRPIEWLKRDNLLPLYVAPAGTAAILLQLKDDVAKTLSKESVISLAYKISIVGGSDVQSAHKKPKEFQVRLRRKGPFHLD